MEVAVYEEREPAQEPGSPGEGDEDAPSTDDEEVDEQSEESFPASDPPAY